jgi:hypothetical protein
MQKGNDSYSCKIRATRTNVRSTTKAGGCLRCRGRGYGHIAAIEVCKELKIATEKFPVSAPDVPTAQSAFSDGFSDGFGHGLDD